MEWPPLAINLKRHVVGEDAVREYVLGVGRIALQHRRRVIVAPGLLDLRHAYDALYQHPAAGSLYLFGQKIDALPGDSVTGGVCAQEFRGARGSLVNHFETRMYGQSSSARLYHRGDMERLVRIAHNGFINNLYLLICADNHVTASEIAKGLGQGGKFAIAVEWDDFIGRRISMVREKPDEIKRAVDAVKNVDARIPVYCGAGVETGEEAREAIDRFGVTGVLAATGFTKAPAFEGNYLKAVDAFFRALK